MEKNLPACPVETTLMLISDRWKVLIIRDLLDGTKRFGEIKKSVGNVSQKVLTANLRSMEDSGLLTRKVYPEVPPRVEYTLTQTGYSLKPILDAMVEWGTEYKKKNSQYVLWSFIIHNDRNERDFVVVGIVGMCITGCFMELWVTLFAGRGKAALSLFHVL